MDNSERMAELTREWFVESCRNHYSYRFSWLGRPTIQYPQDLIAVQELIWKVRPDLIVETGVAHGGSLVFYASILQMLGGHGRVLGIDIEIRPHNREAIEGHPLSERIDLVEASSTSASAVDSARAAAASAERVMVMLDSNHAHDHVLSELRAYSPLVTPGSYLVVFDTVVADLPDDLFPDRPWDSTANPRTAVREFLAETSEFETDPEVEDRILITVCPGGFLRRREGGRGPG